MRAIAQSLLAAFPGVRWREICEQLRELRHRWFHPDSSRINIQIDHRGAKYYCRDCFRYYEIEW